MKPLLAEIEQFRSETGLSKHRVGILLAKNGRLIDRLRSPSGRVWPETEEEIRANIAVERERRGLRISGAYRTSAPLPAHAKHPAE